MTPHLCARRPRTSRDPRPPSFSTAPCLIPASPPPRDQSRRKLQQDFEQWFAAQEASKVDPGADAAPLAAALPGGMGGDGARRAWNSPVRARASPSKGGGSSLPSPTKPPPAGAGGGGEPAGTEVDREILAFYNARRTLGVERAAAGE